MRLACAAAAAARSEGRRTRRLIASCKAGSLSSKRNRAIPRVIGCGADAAACAADSRTARSGRNPMKNWRRMNKDRVSGALLVLLGAGIVLQAFSYRMGSLTRMGAGFIPAVLGTLLLLAGIAIAATAEPADFGTSESAPTQWRGWICILAAVLAFVVVGSHGGLVPATFVTVFIASLGDRQNSLRDAALLALGVTLAGILIFSIGLQMQFPLFTWD
jgi:hypothetical protein